MEPHPTSDVALDFPSRNASPPGRSARSIAGKILLHAAFLGLAAAAFAAHEHFKIHGQSTQALAALLVAVGFALAPLRALARELLALEGKVLHLVHGVGGLALLGLTLGGVISGGPLLSRAALAPFSIMGAAQALMHPDHPRSPAQAEALRVFVTSLPEVEAFARGDLTSPAKARRAISVLTDLVAKAQVLGETELRSDPGFQAALKRTTMRFGLSIGLDAADRAIGKLSASPEAARALPGLRKKLAAARRTVEAD